MAWKVQNTRQSVSVDADVELDDFREEQLLQALIDANWITSQEAEAIKDRVDKKEALKKPVIKPPLVDERELAVAQEYILRGGKQEAVLHLERALGRDWYGVLS
jgi:hypothetical protein